MKKLLHLFTGHNELDKSKDWRTAECSCGVTVALPNLTKEEYLNQ